MNRQMTHGSQVIETPNGERLVVMAIDKFEALCAMAEGVAHDTIVRSVEAGVEETLSETEVLNLLDAPTPLAFWRQKRGFTQKALADRIGLSQSYVAALEAGKRKGDPLHFRRLADALNVMMEDLVLE